MKIDLVKKYRTANKRLIILDYDGTLVSFSSDPEQKLSSQKLRGLLQCLCLKADTKVVVMTGRNHESIDETIGDLPLLIVAEHGAMIKESGLWKTLIRDECNWKQEVLALMKDPSFEYQGTFIEEKKYSLAWHYRNADSLGGFILSRELIGTMKKRSFYKSIRVLDGNKVVEVLSKDINKGNAALDLIKEADYDYVLAIGDDRTDEDMFSALFKMENCHTVKVGYGFTSAKYKLHGVSDVLSMLNLLAI